MDYAPQLASLYYRTPEQIKGLLARMVALFCPRQSKESTAKAGRMDTGKAAHVYLETVESAQGTDQESEKIGHSRLASLSMG